MPETCKCERCGKNAIYRHTGLVATSMPPQDIYEWWCGGCGWTSKRIYVVRGSLQSPMDLWRAANPDDGGE